MDRFLHVNRLNVIKEHYSKKANNDNCGYSMVVFIVDQDSTLNIVYNKMKGFK